MFDGVALSAARVDDPKPGQLLGEYRVDEVLAQGGMGKVFRGCHPVIGKQVAIKVVLPHLAGGRNATARMVEEARAVNAIGHPNIVDIFAFGSLPDGSR